MGQHNEHTDVPITKDSENERPIPSRWRPILKSIVDSFARDDFRLSDGISYVAPVSEQTATQISDCINDYGATLVTLPQEAWDTSVCIWTGERWDALIDLWTKEEGCSDLVLQVHVSEVAGECLVSVHAVYVP